jgi:hypothetical protein
MTKGISLFLGCSVLTVVSAVILLSTYIYSVKWDEFTYQLGECVLSAFAIGSELTKVYNTQLLHFSGGTRYKPEGREFDSR